MAVLALGGCGSLSQRLAGTASDLPTIAGGLPAEAPGRPTEALVYPAVHDMPPTRDVSLLSGIEQKKFEDDLLEARQEQKKRSSPPPPEKKAEKQKKPLASIRPAQAAPRAVAPSSGAAIY